MASASPACQASPRNKLTCPLNSAQWPCSRLVPTFCLSHKWFDRATGPGMTVSGTVWLLQVIDMGVYAVATLTEPQQLHQVN